MSERRPSRFQSASLRVLRGLMLGTILLMLNRAHSVQDRRERPPDWSQHLGPVQTVLPHVQELNGTDVMEADAVDETGAAVGTVLLTSPAADHLTGFSGPTNVLLILDAQDRLVSARIVDSGDTKEHVQRVVEAGTFLDGFRGRSSEELSRMHEVDSVSGATLTSSAIAESIRLRMNLYKGRPIENLSTSLRFPNPPTVDAVRLLYPGAGHVVRDPQSSLIWLAVDEQSKPIGRLLRLSPAADHQTGYQGPTDAIVAIDAAGIAQGIVVTESFDNDPYVGYVRDEQSFHRLFTGRDLKTLAAMDVEHVEGVSGATMTSQSFARAVQIAAQAFMNEQAERERQEVLAAAENTSAPGFASWRPVVRNVSTVGFTLAGVCLGLTHLRSHRRVRLVFQMLLIVWLGWINGDMLSQAQLLGWGQHGVSWTRAVGPLCLSAAALLLPITSGHNIYCSHLCPHGAVQQLIRKRSPWQVSIPRALQSLLKCVPVLLLILVFAIGFLRVPLRAVDLEPFDAWIWSVAGPAALALAVISLGGAAVSPMAWCRYGCATGALLDWLGGARTRWTRGDTLASLLTAAAVILTMLKE